MNNKSTLFTIIFSCFFLLNPFLRNELQAQTASTTITYGGFQACGGCTVCGADYWCFNTASSYCGNTAACGTTSFTDPVPAGNIVTNIAISYFSGECSGGSLTATINGNAFPTVNEGNTGCLCSNSPCAVSATTGATFPCGVPAYNYGALNNFQLCTGFDVCVNRLVLTMTYAPASQSTPATQPGAISGNAAVCTGVANTYSIPAVANAAGYTWTVPAGWVINSGQNTTSITATPGGAGNICVTANNLCGTSAATCYPVSISTVSTDPTGATATPNPICVGSSTTLSVSGGSLGIGANWNWYSGSCGGTFVGSGSSISVSPASTTTYYVLAQGTCNTTSCQSVAVTVNPTVNHSWTNPSTICAAAGSINLNSLITGTAGGTWSGTGVSGTTFDPSSGTQNVTYSVGVAPCTQTSLQTITVVPDVNPSWTNPSPICAVAGSINLNSLITGTAGGTWSGIGVSGTSFDPSSGTQNITYTVGTAPCVETSTLTITVNPDVNPSWTNPGNICAAAGSINLNSLITGTAGGTWSGTGVSGVTFDPSSGTQSVTYTVGTAPCQETSTQSITVIPDVNPSWTNPSPICAAAGSINLNSLITGTAGGTWSGTGVSGTSFDPSSGTQNITYTVGSAPCVETSTLTITVTPNVDPSWTNPGNICAAAGSINLNTLITGTAGGTWSGTGVSGTSFDPTVGTQSVTYTVGTAPCQGTSVQTITVTASPTIANSGSPQTICATTGSVTMTGNSPIVGTGNWSQISGPVVGTITTPGLLNTTITGLTTPGAYVFQWSITNAPCVPSTSNVTITVNPAPTISDAGLSQVICSIADSTTMAANNPGVGTGTWTQVSGPAATITTPSSAATTITGLSTAGTYIFQWSIASPPCANSTDTVSITVNANPTFAVGSLVNPSGCGLSDGSITLTGLNPSTPYNITYNDGSTVNLGTVTTTAGGNYVITGLDAGTYTTFVVTNASGCSTTVAGPASLIDPSAPTGTASSSTDPTTCSGSDGTITISGLNPTSIYDITYSDGFSIITLTGVTTTAGGTYIITGLPAGTYSGFSLNQAGCTGSASGSVTLNNPASPSFTSGATFTNPTSCGTADGTITITGLLPSTIYTLSYDGPLGNVAVGSITTDAGGNYILTNLTAGAYTNFLIAASNLCSTTSTTIVTLVDPSAPVFTPGTLFTNPTTCNGTDGSITISGLNPSTTYDITYNGPLGIVTLTGVTTTASGTYDVTGLGAGTYDSFVINLLGCNGSSVVTVTLTDPPLPTFTAGTTSTNPTTCGGSDGTITITGLTPSTAYTITYEGPLGIVNLGSVTTDVSGNYIITGLTAGSYFNFSVTSTGCTTIDAVTVVNLTDPGAPTFTITGTGTNPTTCGSSDGTFSITGLSPTTTYDFIYDNGSIVTVTGTTDASGNYTVTGLSAGTYTNISVSLSGCTSVNSTTITLVDQNGPIVTVVTSDTVCVGSTINFLPSTGGTWASSNLSVATIDNAGLITGISSGTANMVFTDTITGCSSSATSGLVTVNPMPVVIDTTGGVVCEGSPIYLTPSSGGTWTSSDPSVATIDNTGLVTGISGGTTNMVFTDGVTGCKNSMATGLVTVNPMPVVIDTTGGVVCEGNTIYLTPSSGGTWTSSDPSIATIDNTGLISGISSGTANMVFTNTTTGCSNSAASGLVTVNPLPTVTAVTSNNVCIGSTINFLPSTGGTWASSDVTIATIDNTGLVTGISGGSATMIFTNTLGCSSSTLSGLVTVTGVTAVLSATPSSGLMPLEVVFTNGSAPAITYTWDFGDGSAITNVFESNHTYSDFGDYLAILIVTDGLCYDTATVNIEVIGISSILIPNVFTPNGDGQNDVFTVSGTNLESVEAEIFNRWGQKMFEWKHVKGYWDGRTQSGIEAADGTYFYIISAKGLDGEEYFKKGGFSLIR